MKVDALGNIVTVLHSYAYVSYNLFLFSDILSDKIIVKFCIAFVELFAISDYTPSNLLILRDKVSFGILFSAKSNSEHH